MKVLSLCDGIACGYMALLNAGFENFEYHAVEIDTFCRDLVTLNFPDIIRWKDDVKKITREDIILNGPYDLIMFGSPCQSVSVAGNQKGLKGKSGLLFNCLEVLEWCREMNPDLKYLIENVKMKKAFTKEFNEAIGHEPILINSRNFSAQNRQRYYWINFDIDAIDQDGPTLYSELGVHCFGWSKSTRYRDNETGKVYSNPGSNRTMFFEHRLNDGFKANTLNTGDGCRNQSTCNYVVKVLNKSTNKVGEGFANLVENENEGFISAFEQKLGVNRNRILYRVLNPKECAILQNIPSSFEFHNASKTKLYRAIGNGWTVNVISHILNGLN